MSKHKRDQELSEKASDNSRNNNGTLGSDGGVKRTPKGSFHEMTERVKDGEPVNERGIRENEENHTLGNIKYGGGKYASNEIDPNKPGSQNSEGEEIEYPKKGYNHVENTGGTSEEDLNKNKEN